MIRLHYETIQPNENPETDKKKNLPKKIQGEKKAKSFNLSSLKGDPKKYTCCMAVLTIIRLVGQTVYFEKQDVHGHLNYFLICDNELDSTIKDHFVLDQNAVAYCAKKLQEPARIKAKVTDVNEIPGRRYPWKSETIIVTADVIPPKH